MELRALMSVRLIWRGFTSFDQRSPALSACQSPAWRERESHRVAERIFKSVSDGRVLGLDST